LTPSPATGSFVPGPFCVDRPIARERDGTALFGPPEKYMNSIISRAKRP
jgi:hypothetical protein